MGNASKRPRRYGAPGAICLPADGEGCHGVASAIAWFRLKWGIVLILTAGASCAAGLGMAGCQGALVTASPPTVSALPTEMPTPTLARTETPTPSATPTPEPTATLTPPPVIGPNTFPDNVNPLTGLVADDPSVLNRRPLLVKISNAPPVVRPQSGISNADLIFEHYAEGGWTRFTAVFYGQSSHHLGSVRSVRLLDLQLASAYDGILIFSGGSLGVIDSLRQSPLYPKEVISPQFGYGEPTFVRFPRDGLPFEHTLFTDTDLLWGIVDERQINRRPEFGLPGMAFAVLPPDGGSPASAVTVGYARTSVNWRYDPVVGLFLRWTDGEPHTDALTGRQIGFENVIVLSAYHEELILFPEKYFGEEESLYIELLGEGPVTLFRDGQAFEGRWLREQETSMFTFYGPDGQPLLLKPGRTFIQIIRAGFEQVVVEP